MKPRVSRLPIVGAALLGILVTFIYGFVTMLFFSAKRIPGWVDVFIMLPLKILCPPCYVAWHSTSDFWFPASPLINAALYGEKLFSPLVPICTISVDNSPLVR